MNNTQQESSAIQTIDAHDMPRESINSAALVLNQGSMESIMRVAELMSNGKATVPKHLQSSPADCMAVVMQAIQWQMNPFAVAQKTHIVNGTLGYEAQLVNAVVQSSNSIMGAFKYEYKGAHPAIECRVGAVLRGDNFITWGEWLCENTVTTKNSPLWKVNPKQQLGYLQVKNWARLYCPGAILGVYTPDELAPAVAPTEKSIDPTTGEIKAKTKELPPYTDDQFITNMTTWRRVIESGRKTVDEVLTTIATIATLSEEQTQQIRTIQNKTVEMEQAA